MSPNPKWKLALVLGGPVDPMETAVRTGQRDVDPLLVRRAEDRRLELARKINRPPGRSSARPPGSSGTGRTRSRAPMLEREIEGRVQERDVLGARLDEREHELVLALKPPRRLELGRSDVDPDRPGAAAREPRGEVGRAARARRRPAPSSSTSASAPRSASLTP